MASRTCNIWRNMLSRSYRSLVRHFKHSVNTLIGRVDSGHSFFGACVGIRSLDEKLYEIFLKVLVMQQFNFKVI